VLSPELTSCGCCRRLLAHDCHCPVMVLLLCCSSCAAVFFFLLLCCLPFLFLLVIVSVPLSCCQYLAVARRAMCHLCTSCQLMPQNVVSLSSQHYLPAFEPFFPNFTRDRASGAARFICISCVVGRCVSQVLRDDQLAVSHVHAQYGPIIS